MLKAIIAKLEDVPEALRAEYKAGTAEGGTEGKFVLDVEAVEGFNLENVSGLKTALATERTNLAAERAKTKDFEGIDPVEAKDAIAKIKELGTLDPKKDVDRLVEEKVGAQLGQLNERHKTELDGANAKVTARDELLRGVFQREAAVKAIADEKGDVDLLLPHVLPSIAFDLEEVDGKLVPKIRVVDEKGNTRIGDNQGGNMTIHQMVGEMKKSDKFSRLFDGSGTNGTGDKGGGGTPPAGGKKIAEMSRKEKASLIGEIGQQAYNDRANEERAAASA